MTLSKKEYLIKIFLKRAKYDHIFKSVFDCHFNLSIGNNEFVSKKAIEKIKQKYDYEEFCKRIIPIIEKEFSVEEIEKLNNFLSSPVGKKMMNIDLSLKIGTATQNFINDMGQTIVIANKGKEV